MSRSWIKRDGPELRESLTVLHFVESGETHLAQRLLSSTLVVTEGLKGIDV